MAEDTTQDSAGFETRTRIDTTKPHSARFWNYFVGGKDN
ncbi:SAM-dependent methyltransferase, partial [Streptomyces prasinopilosus]